MNKTLRISEERLREIVRESIERRINEAEMEEGFLDNMKSAFKGAVSGFKTQKALDKDKNTYTRNTRVSPHEADENEAIEKVREYYELSHEYHKKANALRNKANQLAKMYGIKLTGKGYDKSFNYDLSNEYKGEKENIKDRHDNYVGKQQKIGNSFKQGIGKW